MMDLDDVGQPFRFLIRDHDRKFSRVFDTVFTAAGVEILTTPIQAPRANASPNGSWEAYGANRWTGSSSSTSGMRPRSWPEYQRHFNEHRPHRALGQAAPLRPLPDPRPSRHIQVTRRDRLGGLLHEYTQVA